jgi:hypothetical protein
VSNEWQTAEAFKGFDGQVTVGLAETSDQKLELTGKNRRRISTLRINVWATEQPGATESARAMRRKIAEEVNRVIRQNRVKPNETCYDFYNIGAASQTCKAFRGNGESSPNEPEAWVEFLSEDYAKMWLSDDNRVQVSVGGNGEYAAALFGFKVESRRATAKKMVLCFEGFGTASSGNGVIAKAWNNESSTWENAQSSSAADTDETITVTLSQNLPDYIDQDGYVWLLARTVGASDGEISAELRCDYASCTVTVNGVTYCDVTGYRDLDRVDVKPFIFRTEFTVKSWFFENIGV